MRHFFICYIILRSVYSQQKRHRKDVLEIIGFPHFFPTILFPHWLCIFSLIHFILNFNTHRNESVLLIVVYSSNSIFRKNYEPSCLGVISDVYPLNSSVNREYG
jgi:hypothetical protein